jgi:pseudaminic acid cytidylyltransferase
MIIALIPARSGSKRIKDKNILCLDKKPLMINSLELCKKSKIFDKIHLSTDSQKYSKIAKKFGYEPDFLRSRKLSTDNTPLIVTLREELKNFKKLGYNIKDVCIVSATSPFLKVSDLIQTRKLFLKFKRKYPVISVCKFPTKIERGLKLNKNFLQFINKKNIIKKNQNFTNSFFPTGHIAYYNAEFLLKSSKNVFKYVPLFIDRLRAIDIDEPEDLQIVKKLIKFI